MRKEILTRLSALRRRAGLSAKALSLKLNRGEYYISRIERGMYFPPVMELEKLVTHCNSSLEELFYTEFDKYNFDKDTINKFKRIGKEKQDAILALLVLAFEEADEKEKEKVNDENL